jgi:hypothetical protein
MSIFGFDWYLVLTGAVSVVLTVYGNRVNNDLLKNAGTVAGALLILFLFWSVCIFYAVKFVLIMLAIALLARIGVEILVRSRPDLLDRSA